MTNPLLQEWDTPFGAPPFDRFRLLHYKPAVRKAIKSAAAEIKLIAGNPDSPDFFNTVSALEKAGKELSKITAVLYNLNSAETSKELQRIAMDVSPLLTRFSNSITLNRRLFRRISKVYELRESSGLDTEQKILTEKKYRNFILGGAGLKGPERKRFREITEKLSRLSLKFEENVLEETNAFRLHLTDKSDLAGLPEGIIEMAQIEAVRDNKEGWLFTLHFPSYVPFMQYSEKRNLREKMYRAYLSRGFHGNEFDNSRIIIEMVNLRLELSGMLGFGSYAAMILGDRMADTREKVDMFLEELFRAAGPSAARDFKEVSLFARECGHEGAVERWDWPYYSEKLRKKKFNIDDEVLKPYFELENTENAIFGLASELYGIRFVRSNDIPVYHPEVRLFEVYDADGSFLSLLYLDYHPRPGKSGGAWMTSFREQSDSDGADIRPLVSVVANFTRKTGTRPSLLSFSELTTFLHEFGHALHAMLTKCRYETLSGTNVARDFVELPSQFMENFAYEKEWLDKWAVHYKTGEFIPGETIEMIRKAAVFNEGYSCFRQLGFAFLDMAWHTISEPVEKSIKDFERKILKKTELFPPADGISVSTSFGHIFGGGYAAGYYGYKWAEVLDADAFSLFTETGLFNRDTADSFRKNILEKGGTENPMDLYMRFRGRKPSLDAFLKRSGLSASESQ